MKTESFLCRALFAVVLGLVTVLLNGTPVHAATIVAYDFGTVDDPTLEATSVEAFVETATPISWGSGLVNGAFEPELNSDIGNPESSLYTTFRSIPTLTSLSPASTNYLSFTVAADSSHVLKLDSLKIDAMRDVITNSSIDLYVRSSVDGFSSDLSHFSTVGSSFGPPFETTLGSAFEQLSGDVEFRIYIFDAGSTSNIRGLFVDNIVLSGEVLPEPTSIAIWGVGAIGLVLVGRFRRLF